MNKLLVSLIISFLIPVSLYADDDVKKSKDHPLVSRFSGSHIIHYEIKNYDEYQLPLGKVIKGKHTSIQKLEGKVTRILYNAKESNTTLEVYKSFETALKTKGVEILFACSKDECGGGWIGLTLDLNRLNLGYGKDDISAQIGHSSADQQRFLAAKLTKGDQDIYIVVTVAQGWHRYPSILVDVIEVKKMQKNLVNVTPDALLNEIMEKGYTSIYGINFDSGKAVVKVESAPAIKKIATILKQDPQLNIYIVGHTDDTGDLHNNMVLSLDRAKAIIKELINTHKIAAARLQAHGVGPLVPVNTNTTDEGRYENRRVGLVQSLHSFGPNKAMAQRQQMIEQRKRMEEMRKRREQMLKEREERLQKLKESRP